ncbi:MAG: hypothetical protein WA294_02285 [Acidobacteriaceae bacterium]
MRSLIPLGVLLVIAPGICSAETLAQFLEKNDIPTTGISAAELAGQIDGISSDSGNYTYVAWLKLNGELVTGTPQLIRYDSRTHTVSRADLAGDGYDEGLCSGSLEGMQFVENFTILMTGISPSANCAMVLGPKLRLVETLYGFGIEEINPGEVVLTEDMVHFAPVHDEHLLVVNLLNGASTEVFPPKGDALRTQFIAERARRMQSEKACQQDDDCDPSSFDEDIHFLASDGKGRFAIEVQRPSSDDDPKVTFYLYQHSARGWRYCERTSDGPKRFGWDGGDDSTFVGVCTPSLPVKADEPASNWGDVVVRPHHSLTERPEH